MVIDFDENMPSFNLDSSIGDFDKSSLSSFWTGPISTYNLGGTSTNEEFSNRYLVFCSHWDEYYANLICV